jgi:acyl-CoA synthetase (AMP-forming)/AMP-acid ligase II
VRELSRSARRLCAGKLARYKIPRYIRIVDEFPMTIPGKDVRTRCGGYQSTNSACTTLPT